MKTAEFSLLLVLGQDPQGHPAFFWSFDPVILKAAWLGLRSRWQYVFSPDLTSLETLMERFPWQEPDFRQVSHFSQHLIQQLVAAQPQTPPTILNPVEHNGRKPSLDNVEPSADVKLLQALTHEIRTPLTSIRTMTRLLLRRRDLSTDVSQRIEAIDRECQEQISRMELIFRATELESGTVPELVVPLMTTALDYVFESGIPRWQRQAQRYQVDLQVEMPQSLPQVWSNPHLLDQVLSGLIEKFVRSLSSGGVIRLHIGTAGEQLKVQFQTQSSHHLNPLKALGELLMFQPETGCLSLNWDVTKNLFQLLGGKLTVRRRSPSEEILTIFLPLGPVPTG